MSALHEQFLFRIRTALAYGRARGKRGEPIADDWAEGEAQAAVAALPASITALFADVEAITPPSCPACGSQARPVRLYVDRKPCQGPWHGPTSDEVSEGVRRYFDVHSHPRRTWSPEAEVTFRTGVAWMVDYLARSVNEASRETTSGRNER